MPLPQPVPLDFPLRGLDTSTEAGLQRPLTAPLAANVRSQDPLARRVRGGARTGLSRWLNERVNGDNPVQCLGLVVTQSNDADLYAQDQLLAPGTRIADWSSNNFPDGPGAAGPGGGPHAPTVPPFAAGFNRRRSDGLTVPDGGTGAMPHRTTATSPPPPPPPPGTLTRTYVPFASVHTPEIVGTFAIGPVSVPLTPPTDLTGDMVAIDYFGNGFIADLSGWTGTGLPTVAELNAKFVAAGWSDGGHPGGPYESSSDA